MDSCITQDYKGILTGLIDTGVEDNMLKAIIGAMPICKGGASVIKEAATRKMAEPWGIEPTYIDEAGKETTFPSPTAVVKHLGFSVSGTICDSEGKSCNAMSVVEILRIKGFLVSGNGDEPKKAGEGGKTMLIMHPKSPQAKKKI